MMRGANVTDLVEILRFAPWFGYGVAGLFGLIIGSFLTFLSYRLKAGEPWLWGRAAVRSKCPSCNHVLAVGDLIPVASWVWMRGRCCYCRTKISVRYPLIELGTLTVFMMIYGVVIVPWLGV